MTPKDPGSRMPTINHAETADHADNANSPDPRRRKFLRAAGGAGALATLAAVAGEGQAVAAAAPVPAAAAPAAPSGYHETEHIRQYYRTARYW